MTALRRGRQRTREDIGVTRALDRGLAVLETVAEAVELPLAEIARRTGYSASTVFRLLDTLRQRGYVEQAAQTALYRIGPRAFEVGAAFIRGTRLDLVAGPILRQLADELRETVSLGVREGRDLIYLDQIEGMGRIRMTIRVGARMPLHATAGGKIILAHVWEDKLDAVLGPEPYRALTDRTLTRRAALLAELARVRRQGYALDDEECEQDLRCVAAPVRGPDGAVIAALSVSGLARRPPLSHPETVLPRLQMAANDITLRLGGSPMRAQDDQALTQDAVFLDG